MAAVKAVRYGKKCSDVVYAGVLEKIKLSVTAMNERLLNATHRATEPNMEK